MTSPHTLKNIAQMFNSYSIDQGSKTSEHRAQTTSKFMANKQKFPLEHLSLIGCHGSFSTIDISSPMKKVVAKKLSTQVFVTAGNGSSCGKYTTRYPRQHKTQLLQTVDFTLTTPHTPGKHSSAVTPSGPNDIDSLSSD